MRRLATFSLLGVLSLGLLLTACSSDDDEPGGDTTPSTSETTEPTAAATSDDGTSSGSGDVDATLTGALEASWQSSDDGAIADCDITAGQLSAGIVGYVDDQTYALHVQQQTFTPGAYFLPESGEPDSGIDPAVAPSAQITTSSEESLQWDMGPGLGNGSIALGGGSGEAPLLITIDGDLEDTKGGDPVHVTAAVTCQPTIS